MGVVEKSVIASSVRLRLERENRCAHWQSSSLSSVSSFLCLCCCSSHYRAHCLGHLRVWDFWGSDYALLLDVCLIILVFLLVVCPNKKELEQHIDWPLYSSVFGAVNEGHFIESPSSFFMYHIFTIYSTVEEYLDFFFYFLALWLEHQWTWASKYLWRGMSSGCLLGNHTARSCGGYVVRLSLDHQLPNDVMEASY